MTVASVMQDYLQGLLTDAELPGMLMHAVAESGVPDDLPPEVESLLRQEAERAPRSEAGWEGVQAVGSICADPGFDHEAYFARAKVAYRQGVERTREHLTARGTPA